jgi:hypothetical protein
MRACGRYPRTAGGLLLDRSAVHAAVRCVEREGPHLESGVLLQQVVHHNVVNVVIQRNSSSGAIPWEFFKYLTPSSVWTLHVRM